MYNRNILEAIIEEVGSEKAAEFCHLASLMYDIKYNACKEKEPLNEYDFERLWWLEAGVELNKDINIID
jgi:hypothetical protein